MAGEHAVVLANNAGRGPALLTHPVSGGSEAVARNLDFHSHLAESESAHYAMQWQKIGRIARVLQRHAPRSAELGDVGSFTGQATERYAAACRAASVSCMDVSEAALALCAERGFRTVPWNCEEPAPVPDGAFDVLVAADIIEHLVNTDGFIAECRRMLRTNGLLVVSTPNLAYWLNRCRLARGYVPWSYPGVSSTFRRSETVDRNHLRISTPSEWLGFLAHNGFDVIERTGYSIFRAAATTTWGRVRTWIDERADDRMPDLAFGNIYVAVRSA